MEAILKSTILFMTIPKEIKCLAIHLTKSVQDMHTENYKMLIKEIRENLSKWKYRVHELEGATWYRWQLLPNWFVVLMKFLSKSQQLFFVDVKKLILKFIWKGTDSRIAYKKKRKENSQEREKSGRNYFISYEKPLCSFSNQDCVVLAEGQTHR